MFRRGKKGLAGDLTWILVIQLVAFGAGARILWQERPLALVYADGAFHTTSSGRLGGGRPGGPGSPRTSREHARTGSMWPCRRIPSPRTGSAPG
ncbi:MAG: hypothetical protein U5R48_02830 [Gammaproteobacteria bacterium]|nr:hypothetical protein [Gammaproteobacteria bacterium]